MYILARAFQRIVFSKFGFDTAENEPCKVVIFRLCGTARDRGRPIFVGQVRLQRWARRLAAEALLREMGLLEGRKTAASLFLQSSFRSTIVLSHYRTQSGATAIC